MLVFRREANDKTWHPLSVVALTGYNAGVSHIMLMVNIRDSSGQPIFMIGKLKCLPRCQHHIRSDSCSYDVLGHDSNSDDCLSSEVASCLRVGQILNL